MPKSRGASSVGDRASRASPQAPTGLGHSATIPSAEETKLTIAEKDIPLAFLELDDVTLGRVTRAHLIQCERAFGLHAGNKQMPLSLVQSIHGSIALYRLAAEANAGEAKFTHEGVVWAGKPQGDWEIIIRRLAAQAIEARSGETRQGLDPKDESAVLEEDAPTTSPTPGDQSHG